METLGPADEAVLVEDVKRAVDLADAGMSPDDALAKVAADRGHGPGAIRLLACAYNTGRQAAQREAGGGVLSKLASFPLADPAAVVARVFGGRPKAAAEVDPAWFAPPPWDRNREKAAADRAMLRAAELPYGLGLVKSAADVQPDRPTPAADPRKAVWHAEKAAEAASLAASESRDKLAAALGDLTGYFRNTRPDARMPFHLAKQAADAYLDPLASAALDLAYDRGRLGERYGEKRAADLAVLRAPLDLAAAPFTLVKACVDLGRECVRAEKAAGDAAGVLKAAREAARPRRAPPAEKTAAPGILANPGFVAAMTTKLTQNMGRPPKDQLIDDAWLGLEDPAHQNELRKIRAHAMLTELMTDPDSGIGSHSPDEVLGAYNELAQLSPRSATMPAVMRPLLAKHLGGRFEPFESKELTDIEKSLSQNKATTPQTTRMTDAPAKLLG